MIIFPGPDVPRTNNAVISIEGILFGLNIDGVKWRYTQFDGWGMGGGVETNFTDRPGRHGTYDGPMYRRARVITLAGDIVAQTRGMAKMAERQLAALLADGAMGTMVVDDPDLGTEQAQVKLSGVPLSDGKSAGVGIVSWSLQFTAPDRRKYGEQQSATTSLAGGGVGLAMDFGGDLFDSGTLGSPGTVTLTNDGTASTEPQFTVSGPMTAGFTITRLETGEQITYPQPVGDDVFVDCAEGTVTSGGQDRTGLLSRDQFFTIGPASSAAFQFSTLGGETFTDPCSMTATVSPAYA